jgi:hypothetical protein
MITDVSAFLTYGDLTEADLCGTLISLVKDDVSRASGGLTVEFQLPNGTMITIPVNQTTTYFVSPSSINTSAFAGADVAKDFQATVKDQLRQFHLLDDSDPLTIVGLDGNLFTPERWLQLRQAKGRISMRLGTYGEEDEDEDEDEEEETDHETNGSQTVVTENESQTQVAPKDFKRAQTNISDDFPGLHSYDNVPPFLSWNAGPAASSVGNSVSLLEIVEVLNYIESNLKQPHMLSNLTNSIGVVWAAGGDVFVKSPEASFGEVKDRVEALASPSSSRSISRAESDSSLLSPVEQFNETRQLAVDIFHGTNYILTSFAPKDLNHSIIRKFYGSIQTILNVSCHGPFEQII